MEDIDVVAKVGFRGPTVHTRTSAAVVAWLVGIAAVMAMGCDPGSTPHLVSTTDDAYCKKCHSAGRAGASKATHWHSDDCVSCHPADYVGEFPPKFTHLGGDEELCSLCHEQGIAGANSTAHINESDCYTCHQAVDYGPWPPTMSHQASSSKDADCMACHGGVKHGELAGCYRCHGYQLVR